MTADLLPVKTTAAPPARLVDLVAQAADYAEASIAPATKRAYATAWADFEAWCADNDLDCLPASEMTVGSYLADRAATLAVSSLNTRLTAIKRAHRLKDHPLNTTNPAIRDVFAGIKREKGTAQAVKAPILVEKLRQAINALPDTMRGDRDKALLLIGFSAALRRSELVALDVADLDFTDEGLKLTLRRRKTDQEGAGTVIGVLPGQHHQTCPISAIASWLERAKITAGPVFRPVTKGGKVGTSRLSDKAVSRAVKSAMAAIGADPADYGGHSLRAGLATSAAQNGVEERHIMRQTGHKSVQMVRRYIRDGELFRDNVSGQVGL